MFYARGTHAQRHERARVFCKEGKKKTSNCTGKQECFPGVGGGIAEQQSKFHQLPCPVAQRQSTCKGRGGPEVDRVANSAHRPDSLLQ